MREILCVLPAWSLTGRGEAWGVWVLVVHKNVEKFKIVLIVNKLC